MRVSLESRAVHGVERQPGLVGMLSVALSVICCMSRLLGDGTDSLGAWYLGAWFAVVKSIETWLGNGRLVTGGRRRGHEAWCFGNERVELRGSGMRWIWCS